MNNHQNSNPLIEWAMLCFILLLCTSARADSINSLEITQSAMTCPECINWRISGMCFWLDCGLTGCSIKSSVRVSHRIPDLVVTAYSGGKSPWTETSWLNMDEATVISNRGRTQGSTDTDFKKVDVIGHPATLVFDELNKVTKGLFCKSCADAFKPYFISGFDRLGWHSGIPEMFSINTLTGARVMGTPLVRFGNLWPRTGWTVHAEDPKSAALAAQRAADLVTSDEQAARVYQSVSHDCGTGCWAPPPVKENDASTHRWQMLTPVKQSGTEIFGQQTGWARGKYTGSEQYAWSLWRPYSCCRPRGAFLYSVTW
mgnify:CR=1 FL=1